METTHKPALELSNVASAAQPSILPARSPDHATVLEQLSMLSTPTLPASPTSQTTPSSPASTCLSLDPDDPHAHSPSLASRSHAASDPDPATLLADVPDVFAHAHDRPRRTPGQTQLPELVLPAARNNVRFANSRHPSLSSAPPQPSSALHHESVLSADTHARPDRSAAHRTRADEGLRRAARPGAPSHRPGPSTLSPRGRPRRSHDPQIRSPSLDSATSPRLATAPSSPGRSLFTTRAGVTAATARSTASSDAHADDRSENSVSSTSTSSFSRSVTDQRPVPVTPDIDRSSKRSFVLQRSLIPSQTVTSSSSSEIEFYRSAMIHANHPAEATYFVLQPPPSENAPYEYVVRNIAHEARWRASPGRSVREKYLRKRGAHYEIQIVVQSWLSSLPKRVIGLAIGQGSQQGTPCLAISGDSVNSSFVVESMQASRQIAKLKRYRRYPDSHLLASASSGGACGMNDLHGFVATEWHIRVNYNVDAALVTLLACLLEGFIEDENTEKAQQNPKGHRRSRSADTADVRNVSDRGTVRTTVTR